MRSIAAYILSQSTFVRGVAEVSPPHDIPAFPFAIRRATIPALHIPRLPKKAHPMTEELFRSDSYLRECEAVVMAVSERGLVLDRTVFYPQGGGQPGDRGVLNGIDVVDTQVIDGGIVHFTKKSIGKGEKVKGRIDWNRTHVACSKARPKCCSHERNSIC